MRALQECLPQLKNELIVSGYHKTHLLDRIEKVNQTLKILEIRGDAFYKKLTDPVQALISYQPLQTHYLVDDKFGHCTVWEDYQLDQVYSLDMIIDKVDYLQAWEQCFSALSNAPILWLLGLCKDLRNNMTSHTRCQIMVLDIMTPDGKPVDILQSADSWYWSNENKHMIANLLEKIDVLLNKDLDDDYSCGKEVLSRVKSVLIKKIG